MEAIVIDASSSFETANDVTENDAQSELSDEDVALPLQVRDDQPLYDVGQLQDLHDQYGDEFAVAELRESSLATPVADEQPQYPQICPITDFSQSTQLKELETQQLQQAHPEFVQESMASYQLFPLQEKQLVGLEQADSWKDEHEQFVANLVENSQQEGVMVSQPDTYSDLNSITSQTILSGTEAELQFLPPNQEIETSDYFHFENVDSLRDVDQNLAEKMFLDLTLQERQAHIAELQQHLSLLGSEIEQQGGVFTRADQVEPDLGYPVQVFDNQEIPTEYAETLSDITSLETVGMEGTISESIPGRQAEILPSVQVLASENKITTESTSVDIPKADVSRVSESTTEINQPTTIPEQKDKQEPKDTATVPASVAEEKQRKPRFQNTDSINEEIYEECTEETVVPELISKKKSQEERADIVKHDESLIAAKEGKPIKIQTGQKEVKKGIETVEDVQVFQAEESQVKKPKSHTAEPGKPPEVTEIGKAKEETVEIKKDTISKDLKQASLVEVSSLEVNDDHIPEDKELIPVPERFEDATIQKIETEKPLPEIKIQKGEEASSEIQEGTVSYLEGMHPIEQAKEPKIGSEIEKAMTEGPVQVQPAEVPQSIQQPSPRVPQEESTKTESTEQNLDSQQTTKGAHPEQFIKVTKTVLTQFVHEEVQRCIKLISPTPDQGEISISIQLQPGKAYKNALPLLVKLFRVQAYEY